MTPAARRRISRPELLPARLLPALLLFAAPAFAPAARAADASPAVAATPTAHALEAHSESIVLKKHVDGQAEPYFYGAAIAACICAWKFRQKRRQEQALA